MQHPPLPPPPLPPPEPVTDKVAHINSTKQVFLDDALVDPDHQEGFALRVHRPMS
jgi:hypothetical protein